MFMLEQIVKVLILIMVAVVSLAGIVLIPLIAGNAVCEFITDKVWEFRRRNRK